MQQVRLLVAAGKYREAGCSPNCSYFHHPQEQRGNYNTALRDIWENPDTESKTYHDNIARLLDDHQRSACFVGSFPVFFDLQPTEACNMNCIMCHQKHQDTSIIPAEKFMKLLTRLEVVHTIRFQGGEVFLDKGFPAAVSSLQHRMQPYQRIQIITNGFDVEYGAYSGGIVNVVTRGGTNDFEGTVFGNFRDDALVATQTAVIIFAMGARE